MLIKLSFLLLIMLSSQISLIIAPPLQLNPDPSLLFPNAAPPATIPAFPEQSAAAAASGGAACPLHLSDDLIAGISAACSARLPTSRARCCPSLAAALYSAYAASALSVERGNLPVLPDDSESCAAAAERTISGRGVELPRVNDTCGAAYCYCGIRLRRLSCGLAAAGAGGGGVRGQWAPRGEWARKLKKDCARPGLAGCSLCLRSLNQLKGSAGNVSLKAGKSVIPRDNNDCQLMGLTWLLSKNRAHYLPTATAVLRAFMVAEGGAAVYGDREMGPTCLRTRDGMPMAVGSSQINDDDGDTYISLANGERGPPMLPLMAFSLLYLASFLGR